MRASLLAELVFFLLLGPERPCASDLTTYTLQLYPHHIPIRYYLDVHVHRVRYKR